MFDIEIMMLFFELEIQYAVLLWIAALWKQGTPSKTKLSEPTTFYSAMSICFQIKNWMARNLTIRINVHLQNFECMCCVDFSVNLKSLIVPRSDSLFRFIFIFRCVRFLFFEQNTNAVAQQNCSINRMLIC